MYVVPNTQKFIAFKKKQLASRHLSNAIPNTLFDSKLLILLTNIQLQELSTYDCRGLCLVIEERNLCQFCLLIVSIYAQEDKGSTENLYAGVHSRE